VPGPIADRGVGARAARALVLAAEQPEAAAVLRFYAALCGFQAGLIGASRARPGDGALVDPERAAALIPSFLRWLRSSASLAPGALVDAARAMSTVEASVWRDIVTRTLAHDAELEASVEGFAAEAVLQPLAEASAAARREADDAAYAGPTCPACGGRPAVGVLREEGHGARRRLVCGLCLTEWNFHRVVCASCGEERFDALPVYTADALAHVRVDACDTCRYYVKTIDTTRNGLAVPVVDDLATLALDLWARERGYTRLRSNLLRL
jgi:FdhE protein